MNIVEANAISIAELLDRLGIKPRRTTGSKWLYLSPVRDEKTPSFYVYTHTNSWHDFGDGRGGDTVAFARAFLKFTREAHTTADALRWVKNIGREHYVFAPSQEVSSPIGEVGLTLKKVSTIRQLGLIHYLQKRGIPLALANRYLKEVQVQNKQTGKRFVALGLANEEEGYELRNPFFKGTLGPKAISFIRGREAKPDALNLFEGMLDYLGAIAQLEGSGFKGDTIVLNSLSCLKQVAPYMQDYGYRTLYTWLDNDPAGDAATVSVSHFAGTLEAITHVRMNRLYASHKDVNAWHMHQLNLSP